MDTVKKNIKKAIKIADYLVHAHIKNADGMENLVKDWTVESKGLGLEIAKVHREVAECILLIIKELEENPRRKIEKKIS